MLKNSKTIIPYNEIDYELQELIKFINMVDGIETTSYCSGHGRANCQIYIKADSIEAVNKFMYEYFYGNKGWEICLYYTDSDIDNDNWEELKFVLQTTSMLDYGYVLLSIADVTKTFKLKQRDKLISKLLKEANKSIVDYNIYID